MVFRFRREPPPRPDQPASPFTELPEELMRGRLTFRQILQGILNFLFLLLLGAALVGLVLTFAYMIAFRPDELVKWSTQLIQAVQDLLRPLIASIG